MNNQRFTLCPSSQLITKENSKVHITVRNYQRWVWLILSFVIGALVFHQQRIECVMSTGCWDGIQSNKNSGTNCGIVQGRWEGRCTQRWRHGGGWRRLKFENQSFRSRFFHCHYFFNNKPNFFSMPLNRIPPLAQIISWFAIYIYTCFTVLLVSHCKSWKYTGPWLPLYNFGSATVLGAGNVDRHAGAALKVFPIPILLAMSSWWRKPRMLVTLPLSSLLSPLRLTVNKLSVPLSPRFTPSSIQKVNNPGPAGFLQNDQHKMEG